MFNLFQEDSSAEAVRIIVASSILHIAVAIIVVLALLLKPEDEVKKIPIFEMVQMPKPPAPRPPAPQPPQPEVKPDEPPRPVKKKKPEPKKEKKKEKKEEKVVKKQPPPDSIPNLDLPPAPPASPIASASTSHLQTVGSVFMDPLLQEYLDRLVIVLMSNFKPPEGIDVLSGTSTRVGFTIHRNGHISSIGLKKSSGSKTWDRLGVRAVKISKVAPLPFNYRAPALQLYFDFKGE